MDFKCYELAFSTAVHFGKKDLDDAEYVLYADTIFSAMCHEALNIGGADLVDKLADMVRNSRLRLSDAFPYGTVDGKKKYYIPRPMLELDIADKGDSSAKKTLKKLEYIPWDKLQDYLSGDMDIETEADILKNNMGRRDIRTMASVEENDDTKPYSVGTYRFSPGWGLYLTIGYEDEDDLCLIEDILIDDVLSWIGYNGIGGKRSSGLGRFELRPSKVSDEILSHLTVEPEKNGKYMTMSLSLPEKEELEEVLKDSRYGLIRRGGFISSSTYAAGLVKKKDSYLFRSGSVFNKTFNGELLDVSGKGSHPVWRYAKPLFLEVK